MNRKIIIGLAILCCIQVKSQTPKSVYDELVKQGVKYPKVVLAQSILETGWYECDNCSLDKHNIFGLWNSRKNEYFYYNNWKESIGGYKRGIQYKYKSGNYYHFLNDIGYASDPQYTIKLKEIVNKLKDL
jgi:flagellum-specific peptidoglycan hydrolase FlgJ